MGVCRHQLLGCGIGFTTMASIRLDKVIMSSFHESFRNRQKISDSITVSGTVPAFDVLTFTKDIAIQRGQAVFEVYYQRSGAYPRRIANNSIILRDLTWASGNGNISVSNPSANVLRIQLSAYNMTGSAAALSSQTYNFTVYVFDTPFN